MTSPRLDALRTWLTRTFAGRALAAGVGLKLVAWLGGATGWQPRAFDIIDTLGGLAILAGAVVLGYRVYAGARHRLLWRVRRKLILSYVFIGVVPVLLVVVFFTLGGLLFFFNVSAFMLRTHVDSVVEGAQFLAQAVAPVLEQSSTSEWPGALSARQAAAAARYPLVSYALVQTDMSCGDAAAPAPKMRAGPWMHDEPPAAIPSWVPCSGFASLITYEGDGGTRIAARAVAWPPGLRSALVVDIPFSDALVDEFRDEMGISIVSYYPGEAFSEEGRSARAAGRRTGLIVGPVNIGAVEQEPFVWVAFFDRTDWTTGETSPLTVAFGMGPAAVYRHLSGPSFERIENLTLGQILLILLGIVGSLFLIIQAVALAMGLTLARSITGSVHELFAGTERVRRGDFSHKIAIRSRDQLGELASSFNSMTASIEGLLVEKAEKERLEQELRIARSIQMSLLPQGPLVVPGVSLSGHCEPAREVGGDYYDFLPLDGDRLGVLIADVAGKGTSAALYMAELKGIVLSLSRHHVSPRELLIEANRIISKHLDARSFITMTYAVVDLQSRTITCARAGHCPFIYVPGPESDSRTPRVLTPEGMVLGLQLDVGDLFARTLEEVTLPLGRGDLFVLYTDGISEAMNAQGDCFGDHRLVELAGRHAHLSSDGLRDCILTEVREFAGGAAQHDDMTMVLVKIDDL